jgi:hypothetical protein
MPAMPRLRKDILYPGAFKYGGNRVLKVTAGQVRAVHESVAVLQSEGYRIAMWKEHPPARAGLDEPVPPERFAEVEADPFFSGWMDKFEMSGDQLDVEFETKDQLSDKTDIAVSPGYGGFTTKNGTVLPCALKHVALTRSPVADNQSRKFIPIGLIDLAMSQSGTMLINMSEKAEKNEEHQAETIEGLKVALAKFGITVTDESLLTVSGLSRILAAVASDKGNDNDSDDPATREQEQTVMSLTPEEQAAQDAKFSAFETRMSQMATANTALVTQVTAVVTENAELKQTLLGAQAVIASLAGSQVEMSRKATLDSLNVAMSQGKCTKAMVDEITPLVKEFDPSKAADPKTIEVNVRMSMIDKTAPGTYAAEGSAPEVVVPVVAGSFATSMSKPKTEEEWDKLAG